ncbi:MAG: hypothetical protein NC311_17175 [Muribaculaceae bacterium]|nr:hypothetical protein [Muribaculaceae bacterium]
MRMNKGAAYAVKALALMSMQRFDDAAIAANQALGVDNTVCNYNDMLTEVTITNAQGERVPFKSFTRPFHDVEEDYFTTFGYTGNDNITPYAQSFFEEGHIYCTYLGTRQLGMTKEEADAKSEEILGEKGYLMSDDDSNHPRFGLRSTQMYLVLAEAAIHNKQYNDAMGYLDNIRVNRFVPEKYAPLKNTNPDRATAIKYLKMSAETEGLFSIWNYVNRKRWNVLDADFQETITRTIGGVTMTLTPEKKVWVFPIPNNVCGFNANLKPYLVY